MSHTKGPWSWRRDERNRLEQTLVGGDADATYVLRVNEASLRGIALSTADAKLIAAAPDLLAVCEALEVCSDYWSDYDVPLGLADDLKAAIAKVRGES